MNAVEWAAYVLAEHSADGGEDGCLCEWSDPSGAVLLQQHQAQILAEHGLLIASGIEAGPGPVLTPRQVQLAERRAERTALRGGDHGPLA